MADEFRPLSDHEFLLLMATLVLAPLSVGEFQSVLVLMILVAEATDLVELGGQLYLFFPSVDLGLIDLLCDMSFEHVAFVG